jgi:putative ABC transport system permease protein
VEYEVAGVVWSPGIDVFVNKFDMGMQFEERSAASMFGSLEDAERDFGTDKIMLLAANLDAPVGRKELENRIKQKLGGMGLVSGDVREIKYRIDQGFRKLLLLLSTVALAAIGVASLGVTNTIIASIRTRRWQLGILRSIGLTRLQMLRLILAEVVLLGLVACAMGVAGGLFLSKDATGLSAKILGYRPPMDIPWPIIWLGVGIIMAVALLAGAWPAIRASREEPLALLSAGRAAA